MKLLAQRLNRGFCSALAMVSFAIVALDASARSKASLWESLDLSSRLYQEGMARQDAILVLAAARLRLSQLPAEPELDPPGWVSGAAMRRAAEQLAVSDQGVRAMIAQLDDDAPRGGLDGPQVASVVIPSGGEARLSHRFKGGLPAYAYAEGALTSRLSIAVLDGRAPVCETPIELGRALCRWVAGRDGSVTTVVRNLSDEAATILVVTN